MPIYDGSKKSSQAPQDGRIPRPLVTKDDGAKALTITELTMQPNAGIKLHIHPTDEAIFLLEGSVDFICGDERKKVTAGHILLAPPGVKHGIVNTSGRPAKLLTVFPTDNPTRTFLE
jgi:quercetin dioxygenase-like cupin family protein